MSETLYICKSCEGVYMIPVTQCDCMPEKQEFTEMVMIEPEELERLRTEIAELKQERDRLHKCEPAPNVVKFWYMQDNHAFGKLRGDSLEEIIKDAQDHARKLEDAGMVCPAVVMSGTKELRKVGVCVHVDWRNNYTLNAEQLEKWKAAVLSDPDICRIMGWHNEMSS